LGIGTREWVQLRLKELPMPDLDQIKQGEQGAPAQAVAKGRSSCYFPVLLFPNPATSAT
jgi:hypothetical protein